MEDNEKVVKFPASKTVRYIPGQKAEKNINSKTYRQVEENAKNVFNNVCYELFENYKIARTRQVEMYLPSLEDIIKGIFKEDAMAPDFIKDGPEPPRYA